MLLQQSVAPLEQTDPGFGLDTPWSTVLSNDERLLPLPLDVELAANRLGNRAHVIVDNQIDIPMEKLRTDGIRNNPRGIQRGAAAVTCRLINTREEVSDDQARNIRI